MNTPILDLLKDPSKWIKGTFARSKGGFEVGPRSPKAVCWCLRGAISKCYSMQESPIIEKIHSVLPDNISIVTFNDNCSHKELITLLEKAKV